MLLATQHLNKSYGAVVVLRDISQIVNQGDRVGLVGANGAGKSTLLRLLAGRETPDNGAVVVAPLAEIGYYAQATADSPATTLHELIEESVGPLRQLEARMRALEAEMARHSVGADQRAPAHAPTETGAQRDDAGQPAYTADPLTALLDEYGQLATRFQDRGGYEVEARIDQALAGLRVDQLPRERALASLSGGERARVGLATLLLSAPDILLLDEPTNHLDGASLAWLEGYLAAYAGAVVAVSHDRHFLNRAVTRICEIDDDTHTLTTYEGAYDAYAQAKAAERARWEADYARQQEEISALRRRIRETARQVGRHRAPTDNDKSAYNFSGERAQQAVARNVRSAAQQLSRIEADPIAKPPKPLRFNNARFRGEEALGGAVVAQLEGVTLRLGERVILRDADLTLTPETRLTLVGPNGVGKTTLLRLLLGELAPESGSLRIAPGVRFGYLPQESAPLDTRLTVLAAYREGFSGYDADFIAGLIGHGLFHLADVTKTIRQLSPGQRRKLEIARLLATRPNALLLDEPTNYISLDTLETFEAAVLAFPGPVVAVSHDRTFIERFGSDTLALADGQFTLRPVAEYLAADH
ncbi:MAG TPA: ABC-F family ATP-binding cassette domain-containing protein [Ktedonobacterales bacterium]|nr:ABC-F family ATP-binding cassette domain-containing protein [Ktedonobacterales bacterium]